MAFRVESRLGHLKKDPEGMVGVTKTILKHRVEVKLHYPPALLQTVWSGGVSQRYSYVCSVKAKRVLVRETWGTVARI